MKQLYKFGIVLIMLSFAAADLLYAQQEVMVRDLHEYSFDLQSQADLPDHPLVGEEVTFDAVIISHPKNSGLASITDAGVPGRIHVFVTDVNAVAEGEEGMSIQIVVAGAQRETLEGLFRGDVISVTGELTFFGNVSQFNATDVELIGSVSDSEFEDLSGLVEPVVLSLTELNELSEQEGAHRWRADNYSNYINRYVKFEGLEVIDRIIDDTGRPWFILTDGNTIITSNDTSLRFRNDRGVGYAYDPESGEGLGYNYRRLADDLDGPFVPPAPGSIVDISGFVVVNTFDPGNFDESAAQSTFKIAPWDDGVIWQNDGDDPNDRLTPQDWPNDFVVLGFAPILQDFTVSPDQAFSDTEVTVSLDVLLPEDDYTLESVEIEYMSYSYTEDEGEMVTASMDAAGGDTYTFTFDEQSEFSTVDFQITATVSTPEGVSTSATESGSFFVESGTQTSPVVFQPGGGTYINQVTVELSSATEDATIYYTLDGSEPDDESSVYSTPLQITDLTTVRAYAVSDDLTDSPENSRTYEVNLVVTEVANLFDLRNSPRDGTTYMYTGEAVVVYARSSRNQKYLMDDSGGILIDDPNGVITSSYGIGDVMSGLAGTLGAFNGIVQYAPVQNPGDSEETRDVMPLELDLHEVDLSQHESMLVQIDGVTFLDAGDTFSGGSDYDIIGGNITAEDAVNFRTNFGEANYIGQEIPDGEVTLTAIVSGFNGALQLIARSDADFGGAVSNELDVNPYEFALDQNYPNPFNPSTKINYSLAERADVQLVVYDILGRRVASLVNSVQSPGTYTVDFDMSRFASGTYIYRLEAGDFVSVRKMMLIK
ncbi:T9SS C-terminal target domain-containing protein [Rhodohalobacter sp. SW132]|uniref:chitobiase/beta-hexosaminidase C-terminal domain-containing protein n=1 Tax=Rhodohalobacter sp. SW132 TaxID=2293433 RepID=UPI000E281264|nr:chitobiase/beta-hexosaminidase C-terminal domain-containing protein [Rhodohalobacter sp. SW132]REL24778.1 T9SS C-terminal target domain-containing protein [Rhodohalobacter sp. SW132]